MTTYRLPEVLGGGEYEETEIVNTPGGMVAFTFGRSVVYVSRKLLTVVGPPLPEEPGPGAVVLDRDLRAWQYVGDGRGDWCCTVDDLGADWEELNREHGPLTHLIPAPVVEPVTLPWHGKGVDGGVGYVEQSNPFPGHVFAVGGHFTPDTADAMAAALTMAAAKARQS